ncbi:MAG: hypothetical protein Q8L78_08910 [Coxiellaceae bacterium]|nr:hypothetical protein [Coxiellaceae bacterium]
MSRIFPRVNESAVAFLRSGYANAIDALSEEIKTKQAELARLEEEMTSDSAKVMVLPNESQVLLDRSNIAELRRDTIRLETQKNSFLEKQRVLDENLNELISMADERARNTTLPSLKMRDFLNIAQNILKLSGPAFMVYAHKDEHPRANILGPVFMNGIILSGVVGSLLPYAKNYEGMSQSTITVLDTVSKKLMEKVAPSLGMITSFLMLGQMTMAATLNFVIISALIAFSLPAMFQIVAGDEMVKRFGPDPYGIAMKAIELSALSLFAFATAVGMKEDPYLKYQMVGVSVLLFDTAVGIGKHISKIVQASNEPEQGRQLGDTGIN